MMKKRFIRLILGLVQAVIDLGIIAFGFCIFATLILGLYAMVDPKSIFGKIDLTDVIQGIVVIVEAVIMFLGTLAAHRLLDNLNNEKYFVLKNCRQLKRILWTAVAIMVLQGITTLWIRLARLKPIELFSMTTGDDLEYQITFIIVILIVYLIFERGIELQEDENSII